MPHMFSGIYQDEDIRIRWRSNCCTKFLESYMNIAVPELSYRNNRMRNYIFLFAV